MRLGKIVMKLKAEPFAAWNVLDEKALRIMIIN